MILESNKKNDQIFWFQVNWMGADLLKGTKFLLFRSIFRVRSITRYPITRQNLPLITRYHWCNRYAILRHLRRSIINGCSILNRTKYRFRSLINRQRPVRRGWTRRTKTVSRIIDFALNFIGNSMNEESFSMTNMKEQKLRLCYQIFRVWLWVKNSGTYIHRMYTAGTYNVSQQLRKYWIE